MSWYARALGRYVRDRVPEGSGRLAWVDAEGVVHDLGVYSPAQLASFDTAVNIAYRTTRERSEKVRLAAIRLSSSRLSRAIRSAAERK